MISTSLTNATPADTVTNWLAREKLPSHMGRLSTLIEGEEAALSEAGCKDVPASRWFKGKSAWRPKDKMLEHFEAHSRGIDVDLTTPVYKVASDWVWRKGGRWECPGTKMYSVLSVRQLLGCMLRPTPSLEEARRRIDAVRREIDAGDVPAAMPDACLYAWTEHGDPYQLALDFDVKVLATQDGEYANGRYDRVRGLWRRRPD